MKKKKVIVLLFILFILSTGIFVFFTTADTSLTKNENNTTYDKLDYDENMESNEKNKITNTDQNTNSTTPEIEESVKEEPPISDNKVQDDSSTKKDNINTKQDSSNSNTKKENKVEINDNNKNSNSSNNSTTPEEKVENNTTNKNDNTNTTSKIWEELGMSEDDYYNKPIWNWATKTHSNLDSCIADGEKAKQEELNKNSGKAVLYNCYHLYSHSGKYLGEMLEIEYLG